MLNYLNKRDLMKKMGIKLLLIATWLALITPAFAQNEENMVSVKREDIGQWKNKDELFSETFKVSNEQGDILAKRTFFKSIPNPLKLPLGTYQFEIKCANTNGSGPRGFYNFHRVNVTFDKPENYITYCLPRTSEPNNKGFLTGMAAFISPESVFKEQRQLNMEKLYEEF